MAAINCVSNSPGLSNNVTTETSELLAGLQWLDSSLAWITRQLSERSLELAESNRQLDDSAGHAREGDDALDQMREIEAMAGLVAEVTRDMNNRMGSIMVGLDMLHRNLATGALRSTGDASTPALTASRRRHSH